MRRAASSKDGAMMHSRKVCSSSRASSSSIARLAATMPPNAETGSVARA
jgi:hypothetical protein